MEIIKFINNKRPVIINIHRVNAMPIIAIEADILFKINLLQIIGVKIM